MMRYEEVKMVRMDNILDYMEKHYSFEIVRDVGHWFKITFNCYEYNHAVYLPILDWKSVAEQLDTKERACETKEFFEVFSYRRAEEYFYRYLFEVAGIGLNEKAMVLL